MNQNEMKNENYGLIQEQLLHERKVRMSIMILLLSALLVSIVYGTLENPFNETYSKIGNRFIDEYRIAFIGWSILTGTAIQASILALFKLEGYTNKWAHRSIVLGVLFLVATALLPALDETPIAYRLHTWSAIVFAALITYGCIPFMQLVARENIRLERTTHVWIGIVWIGSITCRAIFGNTGIFEMFFFVTFILFLMYMTLTLFEEQIVKRSIILLKEHEEDINAGIDEIFFPVYMRSKETKKKFRVRDYLKVEKKKKEESDS